MTQPDDAPKRIAHPFNGPDLPTEVFADPGRRGWYFREKMPDSVARFVRADLATQPNPMVDPCVRALVEALEAWLELAAHCSIEEGVCCCGDNMENHSNPMDCGHSPFDHGAYVAGQLIESTRTALAAFNTGGKADG